METPGSIPREVHRESCGTRAISSPANVSLQILTQEDWNVVLYNGMASTSSWAALYFVALMTFGNYVLFNLLVAILVEGFQAEVRGEEDRVWWRDALALAGPPHLHTAASGPMHPPCAAEDRPWAGDRGPCCGSLHTYYVLPGCRAMPPDLTPMRIRHLPT